ncbi:amino acid transporter [Acidobacteria bacterium Mor1]|nr:amino acid transporter [Acidobacteria bacterium Mor1]
MASAEQGLRRAVSRWQIVGLALNDVIGSGVYLLPAAAAALLGGASIGAVLLAGLAVLLLVLCFAEAASYFDEPGSAYLYARSAFGDLVGFQVGWMTWLARVASVASLSVGFAQALSYAWEGAAEGPGRTAAIVLPLLALAALNIVGVRSGAGTAVLLVIAKLVPLLIFVGAGVFFISVETIRAQPAGSGDLGAAALLLLFAYAGFENTAAPAGEYKNPRRDIPFALLVHIGVVTLLYLAVQVIVLGTLEQAGASETPLADAAGQFLGPAFGVLLTFGGAMSILGTNSNTVLAGPRYLFALARDGYGPEFLGRVHPRYRTPAAAIALQVAVALPLALIGGFAELAALSVVARLATYFGTAAALPVLRRKFAGAEGAFRLPGGWLIPLAACGITVVLALSAESKNLIAAGIAALLGMLLFAARRKR